MASVSAMIFTCLLCASRFDITTTQGHRAITDWSIVQWELKDYHSPVYDTLDLINFSYLDNSVQYLAPIGGFLDYAASKKNRQISIAESFVVFQADSQDSENHDK